MRDLTNTTPPDAEGFTQLSTILENVFQEIAVTSRFLLFHVPRKGKNKARQKPLFDHSCGYLRLVYEKRTPQPMKQENECERKLLTGYVDKSYCQKLNGKLRTAKIQDTKW